MLLQSEKALRHARNGRRFSVEQWRGITAHCAQPVGAALARKWGLDEQLVEVIDNGSEYDRSERTCAANVVRFCDAAASRLGYSAGPFDPQEVETLFMVGMSLLGIEGQVFGRVSRGLDEVVTEAV